MWSSREGTRIAAVRKMDHPEHHPANASITSATEQRRSCDPLMSSAASGAALAIRACRQQQRKAAWERTES